MRLESWIVRFITDVALLATTAALAPAAQVSGHVSVVSSIGATRSDHDTSVVVWITPAAGGEAIRAETQLKHPQLLQKNKRFEPHVLAVAVGSAVEFPNHDPFFHNVFSLFDGKRFDLGLYEAGSTRSVRFDRAGICYIFCNIHSQMSAVVVVVDTPYFAVSNEKGEILIRDVPTGEYQLNFWEEQCGPACLKGLSKSVNIGEGTMLLGEVRLQESSEPITSHLNKYGKQYDRQMPSSPLYVQP